MTLVPIIDSEWLDKGYSVTGVLGNKNPECLGDWQNVFVLIARD
jgi:hypothetical protein